MTVSSASSWFLLTPAALLLCFVACGDGAGDTEAAASSDSTGGSASLGETTSGTSATSAGSPPTTSGSMASGTSGASSSTTPSTTGVAATSGRTSTSGPLATSGGLTETSSGGATSGMGNSGGSTATPTTTGASNGGVGGAQTDGTETTGSGDGPVVTNCGEASGVDATKILYVTPTGSPNADGTSFGSAMDFTTAMNAMGPGEVVLLEPGTYSIPYTADTKNTLVFSRSGQQGAPLSVVAANCGRAVFDFSFPEQAWVQDSYGFYVTGDYWTFKGIDITRAGYQGAYVTGQHNTFDNCSFHHNRNTGLEINKGGGYTTVLNSDSYRNYDPKKLGSMADGFGPKQTQGPDNRLIGCRAWENSDDGFDTFDSPEQVIIESSWAFRNGVDVWNYGGFDGNGNGFKLGGNEAVAHNEISNSVAFGNVVKGFDQNNNRGGITILNCLGYANGTNFGLGNPVTSGEKHFLRNNVSLDGPTSIANADAASNSWDSGPSASSGDFVSLDVSHATAPRNPDGTLPESDLFRLAPASALIDAGADVGLPYSGSAPDLGAFESQK